MYGEGCVVGSALFLTSSPPASSIPRLKQGTKGAGQLSRELVLW